MGIDFSRYLFIVHPLTGTRWMAVWSQLITRDGEMSFIMTSACVSERYYFCFSNLETGSLAEVESLCFTNLILLNRDLAYALVSVFEPPCFLRRLWSATATIPFAVLTTLTVARSAITYSLTWASRVLPSKRGWLCAFVGRHVTSGIFTPIV